MIPKFRAWHLKEKRMYVVRLIDFRKKEVTLINANIYKGFRARFDDVILMLSTGLKDRNGVEIFEGDILHYNADGFDRITFHYEVKWLRAGFFFCSRNITGRLEVLDLEKAKIIGNIYENPQLLVEAK